MILKSSLFVALVLAIPALAGPLRLFDRDERACKDPASEVRVEACTRAISATSWHFDNRSWAYLNRANALRKQGKTELAIADYDKSIELEPNRSFAFYNRGLAYQDNKDLDRAIASYSEAISRFHLRKPSSKRDYLNQRAIAYRHRGDLALAMADYDAAIRLMSQDSDLHYNRGLLFKAMNEPDRAIEDFTHAIESFDPAKHSVADKRDYLTERSEAYRAKGDEKLALADDKEIATIDAKLAQGVKAQARRVADMVNPVRSFRGNSRAID